MPILPSFADRSILQMWGDHHSLSKTAAETLHYTSQVPEGSASMCTHIKMSGPSNAEHLSRNSFDSHENLQ